MPEHKQANNKVEFRLPSEALLQELDQRATAAGRSRNEYARELLSAAVRDDAHADLLHGLAECRAEQAELREDLRRLAILLLVNLQAKPGDPPARFEAASKAARAAVAQVLDRGDGDRNGRILFTGAGE